jgi:hypothetical protein
LKSLKIAETKEISSFNEMNLYRTAGDFYFDQKDHDKAIALCAERVGFRTENLFARQQGNFYEVLMDAYLAKNNSEEEKKIQSASYGTENSINSEKNIL